MTCSLIATGNKAISETEAILLPLSKKCHLCQTLATTNFKTYDNNNTLFYEGKLT